MCEVGPDWLPTARIQCHKGRIRVGDRNYLSASEALTVYLQQFNRHQQQQQQCQHATPGWNPLNATIMRDASLHNGYSDGNFYSSLGVARSDCMTPVLTNSPVSVGVGKLSSTLSDVYSPLNGELLPQRDWGQFVKFAASDHLGSSSPQLWMVQPDLACSPAKTYRQSFSTMNGLRRHNSMSSLYDPYSQPITMIPHQLCDPSSGSYDPQNPRPLGSYDFESFHKQSDTLSGCGPPYSNGLTNTGHDNGVMDYLDFHCAAGTGAPTWAGDQSTRKETDLLFTPMPSQRELKELAEDVLREAKMKRLLKMVKPASPPPSSAAGLRQEAPYRGSGMTSRKEASNERNRQVKSALKDAAGEKEHAPVSPCPEQPSALQREVDEALSWSAELLDDLKNGKGMRRPKLARDVNGHHSADILLSSTTTTSPNDDPRPSTSSSARAGRNRHRYSYRAQPPTVRARSLSLDGSPIHRTEIARSSDDASSFGTNLKSRSLADCRTFRSMDSLRTCSVDDVQPPRYLDKLKPPVVDAAKPRSSEDDVKPVSCAETQHPVRPLENQKTRFDVDARQFRSATAFSDDTCQRSSTDGSLLPATGLTTQQRSPVEGLVPLPMSLKTHKRSPAEDPVPTATGMSDRELRYLRKGTSVLSDCEDLLRQLQAVNPPSLPDISFYKKSWSEQRRSRPSEVASSPKPENTHLTHTDKTENDDVDASAESAYTELYSVDRGKTPNGMNGLTSPSLLLLATPHTQELLCGDSVTMTGLKMAGSGPRVNTLARDVVTDTTLDGSSLVELSSYMGPGLNYSDLITPSSSFLAGSGKPQQTSAAKSVHGADLPPKPPHRPSRSRSRDSETLHANAAPKNNAASRSLTNTSNPVLRGLADILDTIDLETDTARTSSPPEDSSLQAPVRGLPSASYVDVDGDAAGLQRMCTSPAGLAGREEIGAGGDEERGIQMGRLRTRSQSPSRGQPSPSLIQGLSASAIMDPLMNNVEHSTRVGQKAVSNGKTVQEEKEKDEGAELLPALKGYHFELEPGGQSLGKALVHLGRLKSLVQTPVAPQAATTVPPSVSRSSAAVASSQTNKR